MILGDYRKRLDAVDDEILRLLNKRAQISLEVQRMKDEVGLSPRDVVREDEICRRMMDRNTGPLLNQHVFETFKLILNNSWALLCLKSLETK